MRVCILARKRLRHNTRVVRQAASLAAAGAEVTVVNMQNPIPDLMQAARGVRFVELNIRPWPFRVVRMFRAALNLLRSALLWAPIKLGLAPPRLDANAGAAAVRPTTGARAAVRRRLIPFGNLALTRQFTRQVRKRLGSERFDICQAHDSFALPAAKLLAAASGAGLFYDAVEAPDERSGSALSATPTWLQDYFGRRDAHLIAAADAIFCIGPALARWTEQRYAVRAPLVIRNCSTYRREPAASTLKPDLGLDDAHVLGVLIGSIYAGQGLEQLIQALARLDSRLHIAALGPLSEAGYASAVAEATERWGVGRRLHVLPPRPQSEIIDYASGADFGIITLQPDRLNHRLALPNKLFEYIMARLPVVSGDIEDVRDIVTARQIGVICDQTDPEDVARAIAGLVSPARLAQARANARIAALELCWENEVGSYLAAFAAARKSVVNQ